MEYDPFLTPPDPSNPWITDDTTLWELEARFAHKKHSIYTHLDERHWLVYVFYGYFSLKMHAAFIKAQFLSCSKEPGQQRVKRWAFGIDEVLKDPVGREQFLKFLESEFSSENLRYMIKNTLPLFMVYVIAWI